MDHLRNKNDLEQDHKYNNSPKTHKENIGNGNDAMNKNTQDSRVNENQHNMGVQKVFTFVQDANSKEIRRSDIINLNQGGPNNEKSASLISSSDNGLSGNSNRDRKERMLTYSPLGRIMNKIGLKLGSQTGTYLNKLIQ